MEKGQKNKSHNFIAPPTVLSNISPRCFDNVHDKAITAAILDRITHHAMILNMSGQSFRQR